MKNISPWLTYLMIGTATATWGSAFIAGKFAVESFEPTTIAFLRFFGAMVLLFPIMWTLEKKRPKIVAKDWLMFAFLGLTGIAIYNICFFLASVHAPVIKSSLFIAMNPVVIVLLSGLILKEHISRNHIIGMIVALSGVFIIITDGQIAAFFSSGFEMIDFVLLIAVISWALYSVCGKVVLKKFSSLVSTTYAVMFGTLFLFPFSIMETSWTTISEATFSAWVSIIHMSIFVTVISFIMYYEGIRRIGAAKASIFINVMPVSAVIMATLILGETFTIFHTIGALLVICGVYIATQIRFRGFKSRKQVA